MSCTVELSLGLDFESELESMIMNNEVKINGFWKWIQSLVFQHLILTFPVSLGLTISCHITAGLIFDNFLGVRVIAMPKLKTMLYAQRTQPLGNIRTVHLLMLVKDYK